MPGGTAARLPAAASTCINKARCCQARRAALPSASPPRTVPSSRNPHFDQLCDLGSLADLVSSSGGQRPAAAAAAAAPTPAPRLGRDPAERCIAALLCLLDVASGLEYLHTCCSLVSARGRHSRMLRRRGRHPPAGVSSAPAAHPPITHPPASPPAVRRCTATSAKQRAAAHPLPDSAHESSARALARPLLAAGARRPQARQRAAALRAQRPARLRLQGAAGAGSAAGAARHAAAGARAAGGGLGPAPCQSCAPPAHHPVHPAPILTTPCAAGRFRPDSAAGSGESARACGVLLGPTPARLSGASLCSVTIPPCSPCPAGRALAQHRLHRHRLVRGAGAAGRGAAHAQGRHLLVRHDRWVGGWVGGWVAGRCSAARLRGAALGRRQAVRRCCKRCRMWLPHHSAGGAFGAWGWDDRKPAGATMRSLVRLQS